MAKYLANQSEQVHSSGEAIRRRRDVEVSRLTSDMRMKMPLKPVATPPIKNRMKDVPDGERAKVA